MDDEVDRVLSSLVSVSSVVSSSSLVAVIRAELGVSRGELAGILGVSRGTVQSWELGRRAPTEHAERYMRLVLAWKRLTGELPEAGGPWR